MRRVRGLNFYEERDGDREEQEDAGIRFDEVGEGDAQAQEDVFRRDGSRATSKT